MILNTSNYYYNMSMNNTHIFKNYREDKYKMFISFSNKKRKKKKNSWWTVIIIIEGILIKFEKLMTKIVSVFFWLEVDKIIFKRIHLKMFI